MKTITFPLEVRSGSVAVKIYKVENKGRTSYSVYVRIENPPFLRLVIEVVAGPFRRGSWEVSVAHYGEQNGDAMRDPEVTFLVLPDDTAWQWTPLSFLNDYVGVYQIAGEYDADGAIRKVRSALARQIAEFCRQWDHNIAEQGFLKAYRSSRTT